MVQMTPPMGWNTWNTFAEKIDEALIMESADAIVKSGLRDAGYNYVVIDDTWALPQRDANHRLVADPNKFPHGLKALGDYLHKNGLKFGLYSCAGCMTCAQHPGSYEHEFLDAESFAEWGVDFLKYDYCFKPIDDKGEMLYRRMGTALANCGRDILFSACSWGADETHRWIKTTGANMWRSTSDIVDGWESIKALTKQQRELLPYNGHGCFNDMDMLVVGMNGKGHVGFQGCDFIQYRTHFSLWAFLASPLMIGCDIRHMDDQTRSILLNKDVIAINQDSAYCTPFFIGGTGGTLRGGTEECFIAARLLSNGDFAIGLFNLSDDVSNFYFCTAELGLNRSAGKKLVMTDLWSGASSETHDYYYTAAVKAHDCLLLRARVVDEI